MRPRSASRSSKSDTGETNAPLTAQFSARLEKVLKNYKKRVTIPKDPQHYYIADFDKRPSAIYLAEVERKKQDEAERAALEAAGKLTKKERKRLRKEAEKRRKRRRKRSAGERWQSKRGGNKSSRWRLKWLQSAAKKVFAPTWGCLWNAWRL